MELPKWILTVLLLGAALPAGAADTTEPAASDHRLCGTISTPRCSLHFGIVYVTQWAFYFGTQYDTIQDHGSFQNWVKNPWSPHFDRDNLENNVIRHTLAGQYYYLFYRSRGHTKPRSFIWTLLSSLAFEFTIETLTERPSYQDIYITPTFGTALGMGTERLSAYLYTFDAWPVRALGTLLNPSRLLPGSTYEVTVTPILGDGIAGATLSMRF